MIFRPWLVASLAMAATMLSGCDLGPDYHRPYAALPAGWREVGASGQAVWPAADWWRGFGSSQLDRFIAQAEAQNFDLAASVARVREADAEVKIAGAALLPSVNATGSASEQRSESEISQNVLEFREFNLGVDASYELDFWGKNRAALDAAKDSAIAARYDEQVIALATVSSVAVTYFDALGLRDRIAVAQNNLHEAQQALGGILAEDRAGTATQLDIVQQETVVNTLRASIPPLQQQFSQAIDALAILLGENPEDVRLAPETLLDLSLPPVAPGLPAELLARRPDVHEAETQLMAASANIKVARAAFFPTVDLTAQGGMETLAIAGFSPPTAAYALAAGVTQPIFEGGLLTGQLHFNQARYTELLEDYRKSIVAALSNVEDGLAGVQRTGQQLTDQAATVSTAKAAYNISLVQFHAGTIDLLNVLTAENALFPAEDMLVQVRLAHAQALVSLFQALGGGWQDNQISAEMLGAPSGS